MDDPSLEKTQALSNPLDQTQPKKKKKRKKKKGKKSIQILRRRPRNNPKSYGAEKPWDRRESMPHHATVQSLASINQPIIVNQLSKMSQDLKYQRELKKALMELRQKDEDYRYAIEIGESLTKENEYLKEQIEIVESQLHYQETVNSTLKEKLETLSSTYHQDLYKYHQELQAHKELVNELRNSLTSKQQELSQQQQLNERKKHLVQHGNVRINSMKRLTSEEIDNLQSVDFSSVLEKQLYIKLDKEKNQCAEQQSTIENLMRKLDDFMGLKKRFDALKKANKELKQITKDELAQHIQMQKSIEAEAIYLAAKKANLEEEREDLLNLLDQRDYEITMLNQQLALQRKETSRNLQNMESTLGDDILSDENDGYYEYDDMVSDDLEDDNMEMLDDKDEIDIIAEILDDEDLFDDDDGDDESDDVTNINQEKEGLVPSNQMNQLQKNKDFNKKRAEISEESRDKKAFDKIKEYLHLSASAVKIKYPTVKDIQSDELIKRVRELPFYKYHDQMVRIMETQIRDEKKRNNKEKENSKESVMMMQHMHGNRGVLLEDGPPPTLNKRKSFLSIFNIFGGGDGSDEEMGGDDNKSNDGNGIGIGGVSDNDDGGDGGISTRRGRKGSKKRKKKKKHRKKSLTDALENDGNDGDGGGKGKYKRGLSVQASAKRLKNT